MVRTIILIVALGAVATPAHAHWQYTRWGMTIPQVISASKGAAKALAPTEVEVVENSTRAIQGTFVTNGRAMRADFWFTAGGLSKVFLASENTDDCYALKRDLTAIYGQPLTQRAGAMLSTMVWADKAKGNRVSFGMWGSGHCHLTYTPLATAASTGL